jgi:uncharacterized protein (DUF433 family)
MISVRCRRLARCTGGGRSSKVSLLNDDEDIDEPWINRCDRLLPGPATPLTSGNSSVAAEPLLAYIPGQEAPMIDWKDCPFVVSRPGYVSGAPALRDDPRMMADAVVENLDMGETAQEVIENYQLRTSLRDVLAIYDYATKHRVGQPV